MSDTRAVVVIGGGPAAVSAAVEAARHGAGVTLVAEEAIGGRSTHASLVPSKVLLHLVGERRVRKVSGRIDAEDLAHVIAEMGRVAEHEGARLSKRLEDAGVAIVRGLARFVAPDAIEIAREGKATRRERFDAAVIATGSVPWFPAGFFGDAAAAGGGRPDGERVLAPRHLRALRDLPRTMMVIGGGATGAEATHAFRELGVEVTWIVDDLGLLPGFDRELADSLGDVLMERGVKIVHGKRVTKVARSGESVTATLDGGRTYSAERAFVAVGRRADTARLGLDAIGVAVDARSGAVVVDDALRSTSVPSVLACGDAAGGAFVASKAHVEGWIAGRRAAGLDAPRVVANGWVETVYSEPELALVGLSPQRARFAKRDVDVRTVSFDESVKGTLHGVGVDRHARGMLRVVCDPETRVVLGASAIGPHAAEVLGPIAVAVRAKMTIEELGAAGMAAPTFGELAGVGGRS
ncbi:FAD-dependent oxidoreductase [Sandaracinus amylolyticus]|nr:NAD(P)/FAD-dependent oxidoreductase [Sandaracinus amylolyticus]